MNSWVRYSVSAYMGLLLAGSIASSGPPAHQTGSPFASLREAEKMYLVPQYHKPSVKPTPRSASAES
jgi:hypothetical protein